LASKNLGDIMSKHTKDQNNWHVVPVLKGSQRRLPNYDIREDRNKAEVQNKEEEDNKEKCVNKEEDKNKVKDEHEEDNNYRVKDEKLEESKSETNEFNATQYLVGLVNTKSVIIESKGYNTEGNKNNHNPGSIFEPNFFDLFSQEYDGLCYNPNDFKHVP